MWHQLLSLAAVFSVANGMCFGVPLLQQTVACPEPMVYNPQLCVCLEPKAANRLSQISTASKVPSLTTNFIDPSQTFKTKLDALRRRLSASLPDTGNHGHGSSAGEVRLPFVIFPDGHRTGPSTLSTSQNQVPRSWRIGGLVESWPNQVQARGVVPMVRSDGMFSPSTSGWSRSIEDQNTLSLMERLHAARNLWRQASRRLANRRRFGDTVLAQKFLNNHPAGGISPDTARRHLSFDAGNHNLAQNANLPNGGSPKDSAKLPLLSQKKVDLLKKRLGELLPKNTARKSNSFLRSAMRLQSSANI